MLTAHVPVSLAKARKDDDASSEAPLESCPSDQDEPSKLSPCRESVAVFLTSRIVDTSINILVLANLVLIVTETDAQSLGNVTPDWVTYMNHVFLAVFLAELVLRLFAYRFVFFLQPGNIMDFAVVSIDVIGMVIQYVGGDLPSMSVLRIFRLARLCRGVKVIQKFPKLALLVEGCLAAAGSVAWGMGLVAMTVLMWAILAVHVIHPLAKDVANEGGFDGCARCPAAYETVGASLITIFQAIIAGDSWGLTTIPIIEAFPHSFLFFGGCFTTVQVALLNVILATIVESAMTAKESNVKIMAESKEQSRHEAINSMMRICQEIDTDGSGSLTKQEFMEGVKSSQDLLDLLKSMDVTIDDFEIVFQILDHDGSGSVSYREFIKELQRMKSQDSHTMLVLIHFYLLQTRNRVCEQLQTVSTEILSMKQWGCAAQDMPEIIDERKLSIRKMNAESAQLDAPIKADTQDEEGSSMIKCQKARPSAVDDIEVVSKQLGSIRDLMQKKLVQRLADMSGKIDTILDVAQVGPKWAQVESAIGNQAQVEPKWAQVGANTHKFGQRKKKPSGAGSNEVGPKSSAWRAGPQQEGPLHEAGKTGAAGGQRSFSACGCEVAD